MGRTFKDLPCDGLDPALLQGQLGADRFVIEAYNRKRDGTFLDIGAGQPLYISNTVALERGLGWTGVLCDVMYADQLRAERTSIVVPDAFFVDWRTIIATTFPSGRIDFLSLDLEPPTLTENAMRILPWDAVRFGIVALEHDSYRDGGPKRQERMRAFMEGHGYRLFAEVEHDDWWLDPAVFDVDEMHERFAELLEVAP